MSDTLEKFDAAWSRDEPPDLKQFVLEAGEVDVPELAVLVSEDMRYRRQNDRECRLESYFELFPQLREESAAVDLIYADFLLREEHNESPTEEEYVARFAEYADSIQRQLQLHQLLLVQSSIGAGEEPKPQVHTKLEPSIDGFDVQEIIGHGAMGVVYKARDLKLNRLVAIKMLLTGQHSSDREKRQFQREAEAAARLQHRNVVSVYQVGITQDGIPFLVMEYIRGGSLLEALQAGPIPVSEAVSIAREVVTALAFAHGSNIIHQDIKPGNILISTEGPQIADFGLSRPIDGTLTQLSIDSVVGTPQYMAPEQADPDANVGPACDIYAVGAILYEMLSGRPPLHGASPWEVFQQLTSHDPIRLRELNPALPRDLETICEKCLQKVPARRYASAVELGEDLRRYAEGHPIAARPVTTFERFVRWCRRQPRLAATAAAAALLAIAVAVVSTIAVMRVSDARSETQAVKAEAVETRVQALLQAAPDAIPFCIDALGDETEIQSLLASECDAASNEIGVRFRAACGLAARGDVRVSALLDTLEEISPSRGVSRAAVAALAQAPDDTTPALIERSKSVDAAKRARFAWVALFMGVSDPAERLVVRAKDPSLRTAFVHCLSDWLANESSVAEILSSEISDELRAAVCLAVGHVDAATLPVERRSEIVAALQDLRSASDSAPVHSSARWAVQKWGYDVELVENASSTAGWRTNTIGLTMARIDAGTFTMGSDLERRRHPRHQVRLTSPYWISTTEVNVEQFEKFVLSQATASSEEPAWMVDSEVSPGPQHPANALSWQMAIRFCNWLSDEESLQPCYVRTAMDVEGDEPTFRWEYDSAASGYRLPTEAEWEFAARAGAGSRYSFGDDQQLHIHYVRTSAYRKINAFPCGTLMPNANGLFDTEGNVWEMMWDEWGPLSEDPQVDPLGATGASATAASVRVIRGGGVDCNRGDSDLEARGQMPIDRLSWNVGFRVARNADQ